MILMDYTQRAVKYTDETYSSKKDLSASLGTLMVDYIWNEIISYRKGFEITLTPFRSIANIPFHLTLTPTIKSKIEKASSELQRLASFFNNLTEKGMISEARKALLLPSLISIRDVESINVSDLSLKAMLNGTYCESDPAHLPLLNFIKASDSFVVDEGTIDDSFLASSYSKMLGLVELTKFYREKDRGNDRFFTITNRDYDYCPARYIEPLMDDFFSFISNESYLPIVKALGCLYFLDYAKPFDLFNDELASLLASSILSNCGFGNGSFYLPLLPLLVNMPKKKDITLDVQRSGDLTPFILNACENIVEEAGKLIEKIKAIKIETFKEEFHSIEGNELQIAIDKGLIPEKKEETGSETPTVLEEKDEGEENVEATIVATNKETKNIPPLKVPSNKGKRELAIDMSVVKEGLSDKEAKEYARYLLETNPNLKKGQALFYASHCTIGRYYVIQQFKSFNRCAYETARTSMDKLAEEGYYTKLQVKNKFVYTPNGQGENKDEN